MTKINILKDKKRGKRAGDFSMTTNRSINLKVSFQYRPIFKKELLKLLKKHFNIITLSQNDNHRGRGGTTRRINRDKKIKKLKELKR